MVIIETPIFTKLIKQLMSDDEYKNLQTALICSPDAGIVIKHSNGLRKLRWSVSGSGKRGGIRIIYYWVTAYNQIYMLYVYPKNEQCDLTNKQLTLLSDAVKRWQK